MYHNKLISKVMAFIMVFALVLSPLSNVFADELNPAGETGNEVEDTTDGELLEENAADASDEAASDEPVDVDSVGDSENAEPNAEETNTESNSEEDVSEANESDLSNEDAEVADEDAEPEVDNLEEETEISTEEAEPWTLTVFHTNDTHGRYGQDGALGYAKYKTLLDQERALGNVLALDAGDTLHGTNFASLSEGQNIADLMEMVGVDAFVPGNHDFNYGYNRLIELTTERSFETLAVNVLKDGTPLFKDGTTFEYEGKKVGVFGVATPESKFKSSPANTEGVDFTGEAARADAAIDKLLAEGAEVIIFLSHLGTDPSSPINTLTVLDQMSNKAKVDLVVDGHSHSVYPTGYDYNGTMIASTGNYFDNIGKTVITIDADGNKTVAPSLLSAASLADVEENPEVKAMIQAAEEKNAEILDEVIGATTNDLEGERADVRTRETNLADLITDAMLAASGADAVITNGGGIRASIKTGEITMGDALDVLPFGNLVTVIKVTGQDILDALSHGASDYPNTKGAFPQVAGLSYKIFYGDDMPNIIGDVMVGDEPLDLNKTYTLATNDFMAIGGDEYTMFEGSEQVTLLGMMVDILADYIKQLSADGPITYLEDGRITAVKQTLADRYEPAITELTIELGEDVAAVNFITNVEDLPENTEFELKEELDTNIPGDHTLTLLVKYPDGSIDELPVILHVNPLLTDADKNDVKTKDLTFVQGSVVKPEDFITNLTELPEGTKFEFKLDKIDTTTLGDQDVVIVVTYPDGSVEEITVKLTIVAPAKGSSKPKTTTTTTTSTKNPQTGDAGIVLALMTFVMAGGASIALKKKVKKD